MRTPLRKLWLVAKHEYLKAVRKRSFLFGTLGIPLLIVVVIVFGVLTAVSGQDDRPLGYVDHSGVLAGAAMPAPDDDRNRVDMRVFADETDARAALEAGDIQAFYVLAADYVRTLKVALYYWDDAPHEEIQADFRRFLRTHLAAGLPSDVQQRVLEGVNLTIRSLDGSREFSEAQFINLLVPFVSGFFLFFAVMSSSGHMLQTVADEKENRTIEIMATSLSPGQLVGGKALGAMCVALTQLLIWGATIVAGLAVGAQFIPFLRAARMPWAFLGVVALYFFPTYALIVGVMTVIGVSVTETRQGQQISGIVNLFFTAPFFFTALIFANPDSPILMFLTFFPTTAFLTVALRWAMTAIPLWQLATSWVLLAASALLSVWAAGRVFRIGMLRYGQRLTLRGVLRAIRTSGE